jgi:hypothetical protein
MFFTGATDPTITLATVRNFANPQYPSIQDFGEISLSSDQGNGHIRVDWFTPDALPTWDDGQLTIRGTEGTIELRKYVDVAGAEGIDHLFLVNGTGCEKVDCSDSGMPFFQRLATDIRQRTETDMPQNHTFKVMDLAIRAQLIAKGAA